MSTGSELYDLLAKTNATLNPNNTITLRFNDGSSYTTGVIKDGPELSPADKAMEEAKEASVISQAAMGEANKAAIAAGNAEQSASEAAASATNADNFASEAQQSASRASTAATNAETSAGNAATSASNAATSAQAAATSADAAESEAQRAADEAEEAKTHANEAKTQATAATSYANGALNSLSTTQDIVGVLSWVEESIKYVWDYPPTVEDKEYDPSKQYYTVIGKRVINPVETDYDKYYVLNSESEPASKTGNIVTFDSDLDNFPLKSITATINPKQSGSEDPSPDNVRPISGWDSVNVTRSGKNLLKPFETQTLNGITLTNNDGVITLNGTATATATFAVEFSNPIPAGDYYWSLNNKDNNANVTMFLITVKGTGNPSLIASNVNSGKSVTITDGENHDLWIDKARLRVTSGTTLSDFVLSPQLEHGTTATAYEPYQANTYHTDLPETVYGGSLDVVNGVLTVDRAMATYDGSSDENWSGANTRFAIIPDGVYKSGTGRGEVLSNEFVYSSSATTVGTIFLLQSSGQVYVYPPVSDSSANFKSWLSSNPLQVVYPLAEPRTIQLTPTQINTLLGENNVWSNIGDVTVEYWDGPVGYVTPTSSFDPAEPYYTVKGSPVKINESKQEEHSKGLYYVHDLTNAKEAMADFIKARLALTDKGLYVVGGDTENEGYKILLASDGMTVYDAQGKTVAQYRSTITLGTNDGNQLRLTPDAIAFAIAGQTIAYIAQDKLMTTNAELSGALFVGDYYVRQKSNGKLAVGLRR